MAPLKTIFLLAAGACVSFLDVAQAQSMPAPKLLQITPLGGQRASTFEMTVTGADLDNAEDLHFSFPGARAEVMAMSVPIDPAQTKKKGGGDMKKAVPQPGRKFKVTLPAQVPLGIQDVRVITPGGISNPRAFVISDWKEIVEQEPNDDVDKAQKVEINSSISGSVATPTDVDYYQFSGKKGQRVLLSCLTTSIDSRLPVQLELFSSSGKLLGSARGYQNYDALLDVTLPADGAYLVRLSCFTYTLGGPEYFYRLSITTAPWIDVVVPSVVEAGKEAHVTVYGRNLRHGQPDPEAVVDGKTLERLAILFKAPSERSRLFFNGLVMPNASGLDGFEFRSINSSGTSNPYLFTYASGPVTIDNESNRTPEAAQSVQVPGAIFGRILKKGDRHYYAFAATKGQVLNFDLLGDRRGAPSDLYFELFIPKAPLPKGGMAGLALVTKQEDTPDTFGNQFPNPTSDPPAYHFVAPADGTYHVAVSSLEAASQFGPRHAYTLNVTGDEPDFRLVAMPISTQGPEAVTLNEGGSQVYTLFIWRLRGFTGDITLTGTDLPAGVSMLPQVIAGNQKQAAFVVSASADAAPTAAAIKVVGTALIHGKKVTREVRGATITWGIPPQQNIPVIARLDRELVLAVRDKASFHLSFERERVSVLQGDKLALAMKLTRSTFKGTITLVPVTLPAGMAMQPVTIAADKDTAQVSLDSKGTILPGNYTLVLRGQTQDPKAKSPGKPGELVNLGQAAPPLALTVVPKQLAKLNVPSNLKVNLGKEAELVVRLVRQYEYVGTFKVEVVVPPNGKGLTADPVTLKADENEAKLRLRPSPDTTAGQTLTALVRVTGMFNGQLPVVQEAKLTIAVAK